MRTNEIKTLIAQTIEGQGDAIDVGGGLAKILTALADGLVSDLIIDVGPGTNYPFDTQIADSGALLGKILRCEGYYFPTMRAPEAYAGGDQGLTFFWVNRSGYNNAGEQDAYLVIKLIRSIDGGTMKLVLDEM